MTGAPLPSARGPVAAGLICAALLAAGIAGWGTQARIAGAIIVAGRVAVADAEQAVSHPAGGRVAAIFVAEGASVASGAALLRLDDPVLPASLAEAEAALAALDARAARLAAERDALERIGFPAALRARADTDPRARVAMAAETDLFAAKLGLRAARRGERADRIAALRRQADALTLSRSANDDQLRLLAEETAAEDALLARGLTEAARPRTLRREAARLAGASAALSAQIAAAEGEIAAAALADATEMAAARADAAGALAELAAQRARLDAQRSSLAAQVAALTLRAPVAGRVLDLRVTVAGAVVRPAEPLLRIVPGDRPQVVLADIDAARIDAVYAGQAASLRFAGPGGGDRPALAGRIARLSADALTDPATGRRVFRAEIELPPGQAAQSLAPSGRAGGSAPPLVTGMPVEVFLRTGDRSPLSLLVGPLAEYAARAFRDG